MWWAYTRGRAYIRGGGLYSEVYGTETTTTCEEFRIIENFEL
jgi:hypothetical protein